MELGVSSYTYTWAVGVPNNLPEAPMTSIDLLGRCLNLGVSRLQIADNYPLADQSEYELELLRNHARKNKIQIEVGGRGLNEENLLRFIKLANFFQSPLLRMVIDSDQFEPGPGEVIHTIQKTIPLLEESNLILAIENHDRFSSQVFKEIVGSFNHPLVGICLDSVNSMGIGEGIETVVGNLAPYTVNLHIKDFTVRRVDHKMGFVVEGVPAGLGMLNLPYILNELAPHRRCISAILELWTPPEKELKDTILKEERWAEQSMEYLRRVKI